MLDVGKFVIIDGVSASLLKDPKPLRLITDIDILGTTPTIAAYDDEKN